MSELALYLFVALGVVISVVLPLIRALVPKPKAAGAVAEPFWPKARPYVATAIFSLIVAALIVAFTGDAINTWQTALLAGYTADSTLQKISTGNRSAD